MAVESLQGRPGNLTPEQEEKLRQLWGHVFRLCDVSDSASGQSTDVANTVAADASEVPSEASSVKGEKPKKKRMSLFGKKTKEQDAPSSEPAAAQASPGYMTHLKEDDAQDKYGQNQQFFDTLKNTTPEALRATIWSMVKHDHPDALLLRFLRARKWDVDKALVMMISTMNWRLKEMKVDDDIMKNGEAAADAAEKSGEGDAKKVGADFMSQIRMGKSFLHGVDKSGRPVCIVRVRLHKTGEQCEESIERYTVYVIETARMVLSPPVDTATIIFDMTDFSRANLDYVPVKFMIKCFEANYPECLGSVLVHKAPWVFQGIWRVIRGWLDPVVAAKVHFTNNLKDLEEFIEPNHVIKELEGEEDWTYKYIEPLEGENDKMKDTAARDKILEVREALVREYEAATSSWIAASGNKDDEGPIKTQRDSIAKKLAENYWEVDPYVRARSLYDRSGVIQAGGKVNWYSKAEAEAEAPVNGNGAMVTSPDDVD